MKKAVVAAASCYNQKFFFEPSFEDLPKHVKDSLRVICVCLAEKNHCIVSIGFYNNGTVFFESLAEENDFDYDEIGISLEIDKVKKEEKELFKEMQMWYLVFRTEEGTKLRKELKNGENK